LKQDNNQLKKSWEAVIIAQNETGIRLRIKAATLLSFREVFTLWQEEEAFRTFYLTILRANDFEAFFWEHPGLIDSLLDKPYELMLLNSRLLNRRQVDTRSFATFFETDQLIVNFENLGKNALLIVPTPVEEIPVDSYKHFANFVRMAPMKQQQELLYQIGRLLLNHMKEEQYTWLNTAGSGVIWLHIRLDSRPKYYKTNAYKKKDFFNDIKK